MGRRRETEKKAVRIMMDDLSAKGAIGGIRSRVSIVGRLKVEGAKVQRWGEKGHDRIWQLACDHGSILFTDNSSRQQYHLPGTK